MIQVICSGSNFDVEDGTTLAQFVNSNARTGERYTVNGQAVEASTLLANYNVVELVTDEEAAGTVVNIDVSVNMVDVDLSDFTGRSGPTSVANNVAAIQDMYNQPVHIDVIRDETTIRNPETLMSGDRVLVAPAGGVKGNNKGI